MDPLSLGLLIGGGGGLLKHFLFDKPAADRQRNLAAATQQYSPWTGLQANKFEEPNLGGEMLQFGAAGASLGANAQAMERQNALYDKLGARLGSETPQTPTGQPAAPVVPARQVMPQQGASNNLRLGDPPNAAPTGPARPSYVPQAPQSPYRYGSPGFVGPPSPYDLQRMGMWAPQST